MRIAVSFVLAFTIGTLATAVTQACDVYLPRNENDRMREALLSIQAAAVALDGVVIQGSSGSGSTAIIKPTKVWFGRRQDHYIIAVKSDCDNEFRKGEAVRTELFDIVSKPTWFGRIKSLFQISTAYYRAPLISDFSWAVRQTPTRRLIQRRALLDQRSPRGSQ